jgi:hypothetical protein
MEPDEIPEEWRSHLEKTAHRKSAEAEADEGLSAEPRKREAIDPSKILGGAFRGGSLAGEEAAAVQPEGGKAEEAVEASGEVGLEKILEEFERAGMEDAGTRTVSLPAEELEEKVGIAGDDGRGTGELTGSSILESVMLEEIPEDMKDAYLADEGEAPAATISTGEPELISPGGVEKAADVPAASTLESVMLEDIPAAERVLVEDSFAVTGDELVRETETADTFFDMQEAEPVKELYRDEIEELEREILEVEKHPPALDISSLEDEIAALEEEILGEDMLPQEIAGEISGLDK